MRHRLVPFFVALFSAAALGATSPSTMPQAIPPMRLLDAAGQPHELARANARATVIVFLGTQCPVSNAAIPTLNALADAHADADVFAVVSDPTVTFADARKYQSDFAIKFPVLLDSGGLLARRCNPARTPEAFVLDRAGAIVYQGRIDDSYAALGKARSVVTSHDLSDALDAVLAGKAVATPKTESVGCAFEAWKHQPTTAPVTWAREVAPILYANCVSCHRTGEVAPFSLLSFEDASKRAEQLAAVVQSRYMPPWKPVPDFGHFVGEHRLDDSQIKTIGAWASAGAPRGDAGDAPPAPHFASGWTNGEPDLVVKMPEPFTIPAGGRDIYRAFVAPLNLPDDSYVAGIEFRPGAPSVVHHCLLYLDQTGAARQLDAQDPGPGYTSFGGPGFVPTGGLGGWAPGASSALLPAGQGRLVKAGSDLVIQMHYHPDGRQHADQSSVAIYLQKKPITKVISSVMLGTRQIDIAAGDANYSRDIKITLPVAITLNGITPHMHLVGRDMKVWATDPSGKTIPLIHIDDWDFKWQGQYRFAEPITLPAGTTLEMTARYDNSTANPSNPNNPPARVKRGEQTTDEMCLCFLEFLADTPQQAADIRRAVTAELITAGLRRAALGR